MHFSFSTGKCILSIDPGPIESGVVIVDDFEILFKGKIKTSELFKIDQQFKNVLIECIDYVSSKIGLTTINTAFVSGRLFEHFKKSTPLKLGRSYIKSTLKCKNDKDIRAKLLERLGKEYCNGVTADAWSALALVYVYKNI